MENIENKKTLIITNPELLAIDGIEIIKINEEHEIGVYYYEEDSDLPPALLHLKEEALYFE